MLQGTRKRHLPTSEFMGKFVCKQDFMKYFKEQCKDLTNRTNLTNERDSVTISAERYYGQQGLP